MFELCASILAADFAHLAQNVQAAERAGVDAFHIDIMDGHFVPGISFGTGMVRTMRELTQKTLDVHLMVENPLLFIPELAAMGVERVSVHWEIPGGPGPALAAIHAAGMSAGLALNPETPVDVAKPYGVQIDQLLIMTVRPGRGGQTYLPSSSRKIAEAHTMLQDAHRSVIIQVDGGITPHTIALAYTAGASRCVAGSAIFIGNIGKNVKILRSAISH